MSIGNNKVAMREINSFVKKQQEKREKNIFEKKGKCIILAFDGMLRLHRVDIYDSGELEKDIFEVVTELIKRVLEFNKMLEKEELEFTRKMNEKYNK